MKLLRIGAKGKEKPAAIDKDGKIVAKKVINNEKIEIINIYPKFISEGI